MTEIRKKWTTMKNGEIMVGAQIINDGYFGEFSASNEIRVICQKSRNSSWDRESQTLIVPNEGGNLVIDGGSWLAVKTAVAEIENEKDNENN